MRPRNGAEKERTRLFLIHIIYEMRNQVDLQEGKEETI